MTSRPPPPNPYAEADEEARVHRPHPPSGPRLDTAVSSSSATTTTKSSPGQRSNRPPPTPTPAEREDYLHAKATPPPPPPKGLDGEAPRRTLYQRIFCIDPPKKKRNEKPKHIPERLFVAFFAVGLLWCTSLAVAQALVNALVRGPAVDDVIASAQTSMDTTADEKANYELCAERLVGECSNDIDAAFASELGHSAALAAYNQATIKTNYEMRDKCIEELSWVIAIFNALQPEPYDLLNPMLNYSTNISNVDPRCSLVDQLLHGGAGAMEALGASYQFQADADAQVSTSSAAYDARATYDAYYLANKSTQLADIGNQTLGMVMNSSDLAYAQLNKTFDQYMACINPQGVYNMQTCQDPVLRDAYLQAQTAQNQYIEAQQTYTDWKNQAQARIAQANNFYNNLKNNPALKAAIDAALILYSLSLGALGFNLIGDINLGDYNPGPMILESVDSIFQDYQLKTQIYLNNLVYQQNQAFQAQLALRQQQLNLSQLALSAGPPYNPPPVNTTQNQEDWANNTAAFQSQMASTLTGVNQQGSVAAGEFQELVNNDSIPTNFSSTYLSNLQQRYMSFYVYDDLSVTELKDAWNSLIATALTFDYVFRAFRTFQLFRKYWRLSAITLPPADVRADHMQEKGLAVDNRTILQKVGAILAHPAFTCVILTIVASVMCTLFLGLYMPIYEQYVRGCVHEGWNQTGTMLSSNVYSISYDYATSKGDSITTTQVDRLNVDREVLCKKYYASSSKQQRSDEDEADFIFKKHRDAKYQAFSLYDCIDMEAVNANPDYTPVYLPASNGNVTSLLQATPGSHCNITLDSVQDATFNCANVYCENTLCSGPSADRIKFATHAASCNVEWYIHAQLLGSIMVVVTYILMNASRVFFMRGIARVFWRFITNGRFSYIGTCKRDGELVYPSKITLEGYSMRRAIRESLALRIRAWERKAFGIVFFALCLNIPYIVILSYLNDTLEVRHSADAFAEYEDPGGT